MSIIVHRETGTITPSGGTVSVNVVCGCNVLQQIIISPATSTTTYDVKLTDIFSIDIFEREDETGKLNEDSKWLPMYGNLTLTISGASADEVFTYLLVFNEG